MSKNVKLVGGLLLTLLFAQPRPVDAQAQIRLDAGTTFATIEGDDAERPGGPFGSALFEQEADLGHETGFFVGASLSVPLGSILSISPGLYFVQKGAWFEREGGDAEGSLELSYIEVPVTIGVTVTGADRPFGVRLFAGPEIAFEIDCDLEDDADVNDSPFYGQFEDCREDLDEKNAFDRKSIDVGLVFGADVSFGDFFVNGGLDMGLTSLDGSDFDQDFRNSAWFLGAGIVIGG